MESNREELSRIKEVLKRNPKGMNVIEIAKAIDMHRQSVTKYLEMLVVSGHVEVKTFGPSKVYYLSQRLPLSAMLSLSSDLILLLDRDLKIINVNEAFLDFVGAKREEVLNRELSPATFPLEFNPAIQPYISDALDGKESKIEALFKKKSKELYFIIKFIPVVFDDGRQGATVLFENVTEQKKAAQENEKLFYRLKESEQRFRILIRNLQSGVVLVESDGKFSIYNPAFLQMFELTEPEMEKMNIISPEWNAIDVFDGNGNNIPREERPSIKAFTTGQPIKDMLVGFRRREDGSITWAVANVALLKSADGKVDKLICTFYDITERKHREEQIARLTRLYATLSRVNEAIVRIRDEATLYSEVCRIVMEEGRFPLVWIGQVRGQQVVPAAGSGPASEYLKEIKVEVSGALGGGPTGTCIREGRAVVNDDFAVNLNMLPWQAPALRYGFRASASFPLYRKEKVIGAFTLYASEPCAFDAEQVRLLQSLSSDISNALDAIDNEQFHAMAELAIRENEERLRRSQAIAHLGSWELDLAGNRLTWSDEVYRIFGMQPQEFGATYEAFLEAVHPDDRASVDAAYSSSIRDGRDSYEIEHRVVRKTTGEVRTVHEKCEHFRDEAGRIIRSVGMVHDITERKKAEEELGKLSMSVEQSPVSIVITDPDGRIEYVNPKFTRITGYTAEEAIGLNPRILKTGETPAAMYKELWETVLAGRTWHGQFHNRKKNGELYWESATISPVKDEHGKITHLMAIKEDITERKQAEKELMDAKSQVELYLDLLNHDISNMHQAAMSQLELAREIIAEKGRLDGEDLELIDTSIEVLLRSDRMISNVHNLQQLSEGVYDMGSVDIGRMLANVVSEHRALPGQALMINYSGADGYVVNANPLLKDVFSNLMAFVAKHSNGAATIDISVDRMDNNGTPYYRIIIEDDGQGIPDNKKEEVFHRFKRSQTGSKSSVLSQFIIKTLVEGFHGYIKVEDRVPGDYTKGSRFVIFLPAAEAKDGQ